MNIEEKAKRYDEAIERAKEINREHSKKGFKISDDILYIFPELKDSKKSEDELHRKWILEYLYDGLRKSDEQFKGQFKCAIAWLEKQGNLMKALQISNARIGELIEKNYYLKEQLEKQGEKKSIWHNEDEEPQKDSLILLIMQSGTPIVAKIIEPNHTFNHGERWAYIDDLLEKQGEQKPAEEYNITGIGSKNAQGKLGEMIKNLKPVNEVLEQNPTNKIQPKFKIGDVVRLKYGDGLEWLVKEKHEDGNYTISCADRDDFVLLDDKWELVEQKSYWSEEDEVGLGDAMWAIKQAKTIAKDENNMGNLWYAERWLKSLKCRIQTKQKWSDKDYNEIETIACNLDNTDNESMAKVLRNIRDKYYSQSHWKPSDEQMYNLSEAAHYKCAFFDMEILKGLYDDLKKLKE